MVQDLSINSVLCFPFNGEEELNGLLLLKGHCGQQKNVPSESHGELMMEGAHQ